MTPTLDDKIAMFESWFKWQEPDIDPDNRKCQMAGYEVIRMARKYADRENARAKKAQKTKKRHEQERRDKVIEEGVKP